MRKINLDRWLNILFLSGFLSFGFVVNVRAQTTPNPAQMSSGQMLKYYQQAKASGMSDMQIEQAAMARGFTLDDISRLREQLQGAQVESIGTTGPAGKRDTLGVSRRQQDQTLINPDKEDVPNTQTEKQRRIFGSSFFDNASLTFEPNLRLATPKNYVLGPDDELIVDVYGNSVENFRLKVSPEGTVKMRNLAPVYVNGQTIEEASDRIVSRLRQAFSGLNRPGSGTYANITLGNVRSIKVILTGEVTRPGSYTVSSLATAFNALYAAGGPTENGSFRKIEVIRSGNVVAKVDLYSFIVDADAQDNVTLQDQDIIRVFPYQTRVEMLGNVKREGIFEARSGETFRDLVRYAGGFSSDAYTASVRYRRNTGRELKIGLVDEANFDTFQPQNGDAFEIGKILNRYENIITVQGAVYRPGPYALEAGSITVKELIAKAEGLREDAFLNRAILQRKNDRLEAEIVSFELGALMRGEIADIPLRRQDVLIVRSESEMREARTISIQGAVNQGGTFPYSQGMTVSDLIFLAGGYAEGATPQRVEVARRAGSDSAGIDNTTNNRIFTFDLGRDLSLRPADQRFLVEPFDLVFVRKAPQYETQRTVVIMGEVQYPGRYAILNNTDRVVDLIRRAGGPKTGADLSGARLTRKIMKQERESVRLLEKLDPKARLDVTIPVPFTKDGPNATPDTLRDTALTQIIEAQQQLVGLDMSAILENPALPANIFLQEGDSIYVPQRVETVRIIGEVLNPSMVNYDPSYNFSDYISRAGGYTDNARKRKAFVAYPNGRLKRTESFLFFSARPEIKPGTTITVPARPERRGQFSSPGERIAIVSLLTTLIITAVRLF